MAQVSHAPATYARYEGPGQKIYEDAYPLTVVGLSQSQRQPGGGATGRTRKMRLWLILGATTVVLVVVAVVVGVVVGKKQLQPPSPDTVPSGGPTASAASVLGTPTSFPPSSAPTASPCRGTICPSMIAVASTASSSGNTLLIAARGPDGAIWYRAGNATAGWADRWQSLGGSFLSQPAAVSASDGAFDVLAVDSGGAVEVRSLRGGTWDSAWTSLGGVLSSPVQACAMARGPYQDLVHIVASGADQSLYHRWRIDGAWNTVPAGGWEYQGGWLSSSPSMTCGGFNRVDIVVYGGYAVGIPPWDMFTKSSRPGLPWTGWIPEGGSFRGDPFVVSHGTSRTDMFGIGEDGRMYHSRLAIDPVANVTFTPLTSLDGAFESAPFAIWTSDSRLDVLAVGTDDRLKHRALIGPTWGTGWEDLGGIFSSAPTAVMLDTSTVLVFGLGPGGIVIHGQWVIGTNYFWGNGTWYSDEGSMTTSWYRSGPS